MPLWREWVRYLGNSGPFSLSHVPAFPSSVGWPCQMLMPRSWTSQASSTMSQIKLVFYYSSRKPTNTLPYIALCRKVFSSSREYQHTSMMRRRRLLIFVDEFGQSANKGPAVLGSLMKTYLVISGKQICALGIQLLIQN